MYEPFMNHTTGTHPIIRNRSMQNVSQIHGILGGTGPGTGCYFDYSPLFAAILGPECLVDFLFKVFLVFGSVPVAG